MCQQLFRYLSVSTCCWSFQPENGRSLPTHHGVCNVHLYKCEALLLRIYIKPAPSLNSLSLNCLQLWQELRLPSIMTLPTLARWVLGRYVGELVFFWSVRKLFATPLKKYITSYGIRTLFEGPQTPTEWKSESVFGLNDWVSWGRS